MNALLKRWPGSFLAIAAVLWFCLNQTLEPLSHILVSVLPIEAGSHAYDALQFFFYDTPKLLLLLAGIVFVMGMINGVVATGILIVGYLFNALL